MVHQGRLSRNASRRPIAPGSTTSRRAAVSVLNFPKQSAAVQELEEALRDLVYSFSGRISVAETVGTLEVIKHNLIEAEK